jgi:hypothetical protein
LQLKPTVVNPDGTQLQILELLWQPVGPPDGAIEQLLSKQLLKFVFEECAENNASRSLLHFSGKFDIEVTLPLELDHAVTLHEPVGGFDSSRMR